VDTAILKKQSRKYITGYYKTKAATGGILLSVKQIHITSTTSLYDYLPKEMLAGFHYQIQRNIEKGILSPAMYHELRLIEKAARKSGVSMDYLRKQGRIFITEEWNK
jgi:hypothetical protein